MDKAKATPLPELLEKVPSDARLTITNEDKLEVHIIPVGKHCRNAAAELRRLHAQRDALFTALRDLVQNEGLDPYSYLDKGIGTATASGQRWLNARAAIKAVEGEKT